jgi:hypothetical protein
MDFGAHGTPLSVRTAMLSQIILTSITEWYDEDESKVAGSGIKSFHKVLPIASIQQFQTTFSRAEAQEDRAAELLSQQNNTAVPQPSASSGSGERGAPRIRRFPNLHWRIPA